MTTRRETIKHVLTSLENVALQGDFLEKDQTIIFNVLVHEGDIHLNFRVEIHSPYPIQFHDVETIRFINEELLSYDHVNRDGSICVHTLHSPELSQKLILDFESLRHWIRKYYIDGEKDNKYEHIVVGEKLIDETHISFLFTNVEHRFSKNEFGYFEYSNLSKGFANNKRVLTNMVQSFQVKKKEVTCKWSSHYRNEPKQKGLFCFLERAPVKHRHFTIDLWKELEPLVNQPFVQFLFSVYQNMPTGAERPSSIPLLLGYPIKGDEIHWEAVLLLTDSFPLSKHKVIKSHHYLGQFLPQAMHWCQTRNISYHFYFGRGALHSRLANGKILVIGLGAIGSIVAKSLVRGGVINITVVDYDIKEPENVCRSEYSFRTGMCNKATELHSELIDISPFVQPRHSESLMDITKLLQNEEKMTGVLEDLFGEYDFIFDCTTDNEVASLLDRITIGAEVYCLSITNEAKELICAVKPNLYHWLAAIFEKLKSEEEDLYHPKGCWSPTFKAGYTDIAVLVQYALKQINRCLEKSEPVRNFYISTTENKHSFQPKLIQF
jgi:hypothetical protein